MSGSVLVLGAQYLDRRQGRTDWGAAAGQQAGQRVSHVRGDLGGCENALGQFPLGLEWA